MEEHPNATLMRRAGELLGAGDVPAFLALHTEDAVMHVAGSGPASGDYHGREGIAESLQKEMSSLDGPPTVELHDNLGSEDHAVSLLTTTMQRGGRTLHAKLVVVGHVRDGMISEVWLHAEDQAAYDAFLTS